MSQVIYKDDKTTWIALRTASTSTLFSRSDSQQLLAVCIKIMLQEKRFGSNEEVILETEAYFENKDKLFYKKLLEKCWNQCITLEGDYKVEFCLKVILLVRPGTDWVMCYHYSWRKMTMLNAKGSRLRRMKFHSRLQRQSLM